MEKKISIIIPTYNAENFIENTLNSIFEQTYTHYEILAVNDCSTDATLSILKKIQANYPRLKIINHEKNYGVSTARNTGINYASGKYICFMDSDDTWYDKNALKILVENIDTADFCLGSTILNQNGKVVESKYHQLKNAKETYNGIEVLDSFLKNEWASVVWNKLYTKEFITKNNLRFADGLLHEDELWCFEIAVNAESIKFIHEPTYVYYSYHNPHSITNNIKQKNMEDLKTIFFKKLNISDEKNLYSKSTYTETYLKHFARTLLSRMLADKKRWVRFYSEMSKAVKTSRFPDQSFLQTNPHIAYTAYRMKFDNSFKFYRKIPMVVNRLI